GVQICYDISFPEVSRVLALKGVEINLVLSAGPDEFRESWGPLLRVRSSENAFWSVYANTVGLQKETNFFGGSRIVGPDGSTRTMGPFDEEACVIGEIDLHESRMQRRSTLRFRERVPSLYRPITDGELA
ncbi:MAG TPA: carbon-nitrogen hydrolase family protein, partial [Thermomicrobiales bacterium]|nr:carbon-nitrogen hydrolase family protein [Thermomicrobiales bacterium]